MSAHTKCGVGWRTALQSNNRVRLQKVIQSVIRMIVEKEKQNNFHWPVVRISQKLSPTINEIF